MTDHQYVLLGASRNGNSFVMADGSWNYSYWLAGQPDNNGGNENCVATIDLNGYGWSDVSCTFQGIAICQVAFPPGAPSTGTNYSLKT